MRSPGGNSFVAFSSVPRLGGPTRSTPLVSITVSPTGWSLCAFYKFDALFGQLAGKLMADRQATVTSG